MRTCWKFAAGTACALSLFLMLPSLACASSTYSPVVGSCAPHTGAIRTVTLSWKDNPPPGQHSISVAYDGTCVQRGDKIEFKLDNSANGATWSIDFPKPSGTSIFEKVNAKDCVFGSGPGASCTVSAKTTTPVPNGTYNYTVNMKMPASGKSDHFDPQVILKNSNIQGQGNGK